MQVWTDPPLEMRRGTDYTIACISNTTGRSSIFRAPDLSSAQIQLTSILDQGDMGRIYDKEGNPV
jgi:hypothetical protein